MLPSRVFIPIPPDPTQEDIFSSSLSSLFTDDAQNSHGVPGHAVVYQSPRHGDVALRIPQHPDVEEGRKLFAHYLWNAGIVAADAIESASAETDLDKHAEHGERMIWNKNYWDVRGKDLLELGAGTALPSLVAALSGARSIAITDHPSSPALTNDTILHNVRENLKIDPQNPLTSSFHQDQDQDQDQDQCLPSRTPALSSVSIAGLTWGDKHFTSASKYGRLADPQPARNSFDKIIIADCLWMPAQHENIVRTIHMWLRRNGTTPSLGEESNHEHGPKTPPCALVVAGFHTGRSTVAAFFEVATGSRDMTPNYHDKDFLDSSPTQGDEDMVYEGSVRGKLSAAEVFEVDVNLNVRGWKSERPAESKGEAKRWCVCAVLVRK